MTRIFVNEKEKKILSAITYTAPYQERKPVQYSVITDDDISEIKIVFDIEVKSLTIRPIRYNIDYRIVDNHTVLLSPHIRCNISVEPNDDIDSAVLIFSKISELLKKENYKNVIYFKAGRHFADTLEINKDSTLIYLDEGAVVDGRIIIKNCNDIGIDGFGTLTYECFDNRERLMYFQECTNLNIQNITLKDSSNWNVCLQNCENVHIDNIKIIGCRGNSDGIDVCNSKNVSVENIFTRTWDDSFVVKGMKNGSCEHIYFKNCVLWNDFARPMEIGVETRADEISDIVFDNIDVIHSVTRYPIMGIHHGDRAKIHNITFKNITIEDTPGAQLVDMRIVPSAWNTDSIMGSIYDVRFQNINVLENSDTSLLPYHSRIQGFSDKNNISNVIFEDICIGGKFAASKEALGLYVLDYVSNVNICTTKTPKSELIDTKISVSVGKYNNGFYSVAVAVTFKNPSSNEKIGRCKLIVSPDRTNNFENEISFNIEPNGTYETVKELLLPAGRYAFSIAGKNSELLASNAFINLKLLLEKTFDKCPSYKFSDSYGNSHDEDVRFAIEGNTLKIKSELIKLYDITVYAAKLTDYQENEMLFSTEDSNCGDAPALTIGSNGECMEAPQIGCPEEISFVFENYPKVDISSIKIHRKLTNIAYVPLEILGINDDVKEFRLELVLHSDYEKRYNYSLFGSPIPKETSHEPKVMAHMFLHVKKY